MRSKLLINDTFNLYFSKNKFSEILLGPQRSQQKVSLKMESINSISLNKSNVFFQTSHEAHFLFLTYHIYTQIIQNTAIVDVMTGNV